MPARHVVVDGSNIATEGSSLPTLKQLDVAVREFLVENPDDVVTVVVDATFGHRIPVEERARFEQAELEGDVVSPPAGAIGRGDAFLLRVADKVGASVLSNDSFQEFHGEYEWLFDKGRLIGGKPVPGVGWIFTPRSPVRGPRSRESVKEAKRKRRPEDAEESGLEMVSGRSRARGGERKLQRAIAVAVEEAVEPEKAGTKRRRRRRGTEAPSDPLNEPFSFITFIASNQLGDEVEGTVEEFSSHGAFISVGAARCYLPLSGMGDVPPRSAREVLRKGEKRPFVVQAFDAMRRGIELALPGYAHPAGMPTPETIDAEIHHGESADAGEAAPPLEAAPRTSGRSRRRPADRPAAMDAEPDELVAPVVPLVPAGTGRATSRRRSAKTAVTEEVAASPTAPAPARAAKAAKPAASKVAATPARAVSVARATPAVELPPAKATRAKSVPAKAATVEPTSTRSSSTRGTSTGSSSARSSSAKSASATAKATTATPASARAKATAATPAPTRSASTRSGSTGRTRAGSTTATAPPAPPAPAPSAKAGTTRAGASRAGATRVGPTKAGATMSTGRAPRSAKLAAVAEPAPAVGRTPTAKKRASLEQAPPARSTAATDAVAPRRGARKVANDPMAPAASAPPSRAIATKKGRSASPAVPATPPAAPATPGPRGRSAKKVAAPVVAAEVSTARSRRRGTSTAQSGPAQNPAPADGSTPARGRRSAASTAAAPAASTPSDGAGSSRRRGSSADAAPAKAASSSGSPPSSRRGRQR